MGLIDLKTDLKSLKYGSMPLGSDAPYITKDINNPPSSNQFSMQVTKRVDDLSRIAQMLVDKPGLKYLANEALLQQIGVGSRIEKARKSGKSIAGAVIQQLGTTVINTVKIAGSTLAQVPVNGTGTHFLKGFRTDTYLQPAGGNNASAFAQFFGAGGVEGAQYALRGEEVPGEHGTELLDKDSKLLTPSSTYTVDSSYSETITPEGQVNRVYTLEPVPNSKPTNTQGTDLAGLVNDFAKDNYSQEEGKGYAKVSTNTATNNATTGTPVPVGPGTDTTATKGDLGVKIPPPVKFGPTTPNKAIRDFRPKKGSAAAKNYVAKSGINYASQNMESRIHLGKQGKNRSGDNYRAKDGETTDKVNELPIGYKRQDASKEAIDLAKFFFEIITPDDSSRGHGNFIHFRAYIESIDDSYTADWQTHKYVGRAENFQTYGGFDRDISVSFKIAAMTRQELKPLYQKIVYLASTTAPTYSSTFMRGTVVKMTIGSYINQQPGVITSVKYSLVQDMPWEIAMQGPSGGESDVQELPMGLQCTVSFRPIHNFAPQTGLYPYITSVDTKAKFFTETQHKDIR